MWGVIHQAIGRWGPHLKGTGHHPALGKHQARSNEAAVHHEFHVGSATGFSTWPSDVLLQRGARKTHRFLVIDI